MIFSKKYLSFTKLMKLLIVFAFKFKKILFLNPKRKEVLIFSD